MKRTTGNHKQSNKGFTLVEVLVAIVILAIIVVPLLSAFVVSARTNAKARQTMRATTLAQNIMEELKAHSLETSADNYNNQTDSYETVQDDLGVHRILTTEAEEEGNAAVIKRIDERKYTDGKRSWRFNVRSNIRTDY